MNKQVIWDAVTRGDERSRCWLAGLSLIALILTHGNIFPDRSQEKYLFKLQKFINMQIYPTMPRPLSLLGFSLFWLVLQIVCVEQQIPRGLQQFHMQNRQDTPYR